MRDVTTALLKTKINYLMQGVLWCVGCYLSDDLSLICVVHDTTTMLLVCSNNNNYSVKCCDSADEVEINY